MTSFTKIAGSWGIVTDQTFNPGDRVTVSKRNGGTTEVTLGTYAGRKPGAFGGHLWMLEERTVKCAHCKQEISGMYFTLHSGAVRSILCPPCVRQVNV